MIKIVRYDAEQANRWDEFVHNSCNGTFLHLRNYMDYHSDRFADHSLMAFDNKRRLMAVLPANISDTTLHSHQGLTYGGWLTSRRHHATCDMLELWDGFTAMLREEGISNLIYKPVPHIYQRYPSDDDLYALFRHGAVQETCMVSSAIPLSEPVLMNETSRQLAKSAGRNGISIGCSDDYEGFMALLASRLEERYGATPVHTPAEIMMLAGRFPENIRLVTATSAEGEMLAGSVVFVTDTVIHTQYIATSPEGRRCGVFSAIVTYLLEKECGGKRWLDFGTSCEDGGRSLNAGLNAQKYGFGGRTTIYSSYRLSL